MRNLIISLLSLLPFATAAADNIYDGVPFSMAQVEKPQIPSYTVCITDFGGKSDGTTLNTEAFRKAMAHLAENGGGKLIVPAGLWHTGPIEMKSHTELHLEDGALIVFTADRSQYPLIDTYFEGVRSRRCMSPLTAHNVTDIAITGRGTINANGQAWRPVKKGKMTAGQWDALLKEGVTNKKGDVWFPTQDIHDANTDKTLMENAIKTDTKEAWAKVHDSLRPALLSIVGCKRALLIRSQHQLKQSFLQPDAAHVRFIVTPGQFLRPVAGEAAAHLSGPHGYHFLCASIIEHLFGFVKNYF